MRVVYLAAGAAGMICGSCLRDNRLVSTLRAQGRDVVLFPLYTPIRTDEEDVSEQRVLFGGINVYLQQMSGLFRWLPRPVRGMLDAPRLLNGLGDRASRTQPEDVGPLTLAVLDGDHGRVRAEVERLVEALRILRPQIVNLPNLMMLGLAEPLKKQLGAKILCTLSGEDIFLDRLRMPYRAQAFAKIRALAEHVDGFVALTNYYADHASAHFGVPRPKIAVVPLGIRVEDFQRDGAARPAIGERSPVIGYLARICHEKGLANLVESFLALRREGHNPRLLAAGYLGAGDRRYLEKIQKRIAAAGAAEHFEYRGEITRADKIALLHEIDLFSVPTEYPEAKGISILEAMAAGVPVVQPAHGSFPELVQTAGGGVLYAPHDVGALTAALRSLLVDPSLRERLGAAARKNVHAFHSDDKMAREAWTVYERFLHA
ncbi:MAG: glycosyltransferase family 4 protein [Phycisphaerae bacterium]